MKKIFQILSLLLLIGIIFIITRLFFRTTPIQHYFSDIVTDTSVIDVPSIITKNKVNLSVPFVPEAPGTNWVEPWYNGCEEATIVMVEQFYLGKKTLQNSESQKLMLKLFDYQNANGYQVDLNAQETENIINNFTTFKSAIKANPTLEEIKNELQAGYPVIALLNGEILYNKLYGNGYHMFVIKGYDDDKKSFITNDNGNSRVGHDKLYSYITIQKALSDFDHQTKKVLQSPTVLFTRPATIIQ